MRHLLASALVLLASPALAEPPRVVATIKPIHSLVAAVMGDLGSPTLLVKSGASPHAYSLRPSDAAALQDADIVFWTGHGMELFLEDSIETLVTTATIVELSQSPGIELLLVREGGAFEPHGDEDEHEGHEDEAEEHGGEVDMHFWLDPANAALMLDVIVETLAADDPEHASEYAANARQERAALAALDEALDARLAPIRDKPFIVFHDAYQYFERRFGLEIAGSLTVTPDTMPGAQRVAELRARILERGADCIFAEPQFEPAIVAILTEGTPARSGTLDPEGAALTEGPGLYRQLLHGLADSFVACLGAP